MDLFQLYGCWFHYLFLGRPMFLLPVAPYSYSTWGMPTSAIRIVLKIRKAIVNFAISVYLSVRSHEITRLALDGFQLNLVLENFLKICRKNFKFH
jgi:hypothetical protein